MPKLRTFLGEPAKASFEVSLSEQSKLRRPFKGSEFNGLVSTTDARLPQKCTVFRSRFVILRSWHRAANIQA